MGVRRRLAAWLQPDAQPTSSQSSISAPSRTQRTVVPGSILFRDTQNNARRKTTVSRDDNRFQATAERPSSIRLSDLEKVFRQEPLLKRGILKHSADLVREWFTLETPDGEEHPRNEEFQDWARSEDLQSKLEDLIVSAHVYGDGFLELAWSDENPSDAETIGMETVGDTAQLEHVFLADPFNIELQTPEGEDDQAWLVETRNGAQKDLILHPDRYDQLKLHSLPGYLHGLSTAEAAWHAAHSKVMGDQASGEILFHNGSPMRHAVGEGADDDETDRMEAILNTDEVFRGFATDETWEINQLNPNAVDPGPYYDHFIESIAAAVGMPKAKLRGAQAGTLAGSKLNERDYHEALSGLQENVLTDLVQRLAQGRLGADSDEVAVRWHSFDVSPEVQASVNRDRARALTDLVNSGVNPQAAAEELGFDLEEDAFREVVPSAQQAATIPPGGGV